MRKLSATTKAGIRHVGKCIVLSIVTVLVAIIAVCVLYGIAFHLIMVLPINMVTVILGAVAVTCAGLSAYLEFRGSRKSIDKSETRR